MPLNNLDYFFLAQEMQTLIGAFVNKIYLIDENGSFRFKFHTKDGEKNLFCKLGDELHLTNFSINAEKPSNFIMQLRKHLENARVSEISQVNFDRLICIRFEKKDAFRLYFEMFGKGNLILCEDNGKIIATFKREEYETRALKFGEQYNSPPNEKLLPNQVLPENFDKLKGKTVAAMSKIVNLSPAALEQVCKLAGIDKKSEITLLTSSDKQKLSKALKDILTQFKPIVYTENVQGRELGLGVSSVELERFESFEKKEFETLSKALDAFQELEKKEVGKDDKFIGKKRAELEKLEYQLSQQEKAFGEFSEREQKSREVGEKIFENFDLIEKIIKKVKELKKDGKSNAEIKQLLKLEKVENQEIEAEL